jgi:hypothetical protein
MTLRFYSMSKGTKQEKIFAGYLDRVLSGKEVPADAPRDADMASALNFARKVAELQPVISPRFQKELKNRLLEKLEKQETAARKPGWNWDIFRQPVWRAVTAIFLVVVVVSALWNSGVFKLLVSPPSTTTTGTTTTGVTTTVPSTTVTSSSTTTMTSTTTTVMPVAGAILGFDVVTTKAIYAAGEPVVINLTYKNVSNQKVDLDKMPPIISVMDSATGKPVYTFTAGKETRTLYPGATVKFTYDWNQTDFEGLPVTGNYYIELEDLQYQGQTLKFQLPRPVSFEIL